MHDEEPQIPAESLRRLFEPRSIALVGASDRNVWTRQVLAGLESLGYDGALHLVNPRSPEAHGRPTVPRIQDIPERVDVAYIMVPGAAALDVLDDAAAAGVTSGVLLTSGFAEAGVEGRARQEALVAKAREHGMALIGPNTLGFVNVPKKVNLFPGSGRGGMRQGHVALVSQSGALGGLMSMWMSSYGAGLSLLATTGNEAVLSVADVVEYLVDDDDTHAIAVFAESIKRPAALLRAARKAREAKKPIVALKVGRSELAAKTAAAHTGAVVGDDRVVDAVFRQAGIIRVESMEEMVCTASLLAHTGPIRGRRLGVVGMSGGACDLIADRAEELELELPTFAAESEGALRAVLADYSTVQNPLDVTGAAVTDPAMFGSAAAIVGADPNVDVLLVQHEIALPATPQSEARLRGIAAALDAAPVPAVFSTTLGHGFTVEQRELIAAIGLPVVGGGLRDILPAIAHGAWWTARLDQQLGDSDDPRTALTDLPTADERRGTWSEAQARDLLATAGVPTISAELASDPEKAVVAAEGIGFPVVVKAVSPQLAHKSDVGAVRLDLRSAADVRAACDDIAARIAALPNAPRLDGFMVSPMRSGGTELLLGVVRDEIWGQVLAVGLGGVWTEIFADASVRILPVSRTDVRAMLDELKGAELLQGARGAVPADIDQLVEVVLRFTHLAAALGDDLESLEVNPLRVDGTTVEALDALVSWVEASPGS